MPCSPGIYAWYLRRLMEHVGLDPANPVFASNVAEWCREQGIEEPDRDKPLRPVAGAGTGSRVIVATLVDDYVILQGDEFAEDEWIFEQMDRIGMLAPQDTKLDHRNHLTW